MQNAPTARLARAWAQARSRLDELCGRLTFSPICPPETAKVAVVKTSAGRSRSARDSGHPTVLERRGQ
jgi:hypothetical protein